MRILLDENMPEGLLEPLRLLGHTADSVDSLRLKGLDNARLYRKVAQAYDLFFTKDRAFGARVRAIGFPAPVRIVINTIRQMPEAEFVAAFLVAFQATDWSRPGAVTEWPG